MTRQDEQRTRVTKAHNQNEEGTSRHKEITSKSIGNGLELGENMNAG